MSEFFYKEKLGPVFSPVISVRHENISPVVASAIDNLLSPSGNMFTKAEAVRNLMSIEKIGLEQTAKVLSLKMSDVADKLRLLEFSDKERGAILEYGYSESCALLFLSLDKISRLYAMEYCHENNYSKEQIQKYVEDFAASVGAKRAECRQKIGNIRKTVINDIGFLLNSIENVLRMARNAGFEIENDKSEKNDEYDIHIRVKKQKK